MSIFFLTQDKGRYNAETMSEVKETKKARAMPMSNRCSGDNLSREMVVESKTFER